MNDIVTKEWKRKKKKQYVKIQKKNYQKEILSREERENFKAKPRMFSYLVGTLESKQKNVSYSQSHYNPHKYLSDPRLNIYFIIFLSVSLSREP